MSHKPTFASVTSKPCECGYLQESASAPDNPIRFDEKSGEFQFIYAENGPEVSAMLILYHCPFCGGAAPGSKRSLLFKVIPNDEEERLVELLKPIRTMDDAIGTLGKPDFDDFSIGRMPERDCKAPTTQYSRTIHYRELSDIADVCIIERTDGSAYWQLQGKPLES